jgi:hypothetical protein
LKLDEIGTLAFSRHNKHVQKNLLKKPLLTKLGATWFPNSVPPGFPRQRGKIFSQVDLLTHATIGAKI